MTLGHIAVCHQRLFLTLFMFLTALENTRDFIPNFAMTLSGLSVYPEDMIMVVGTFAALVRIQHWRLRGISRTVVLVLVLLVGLGAIAWISTFGIKLGTNSWRLQMLILSLVIYTTTRPRAWSWNDLRVIIVASAIIVALSAAVGIFLYGLGSSSSALEIEGVMRDSRPVLAPGSLLMLVGLWVTLFSAETWKGKRLPVIGLLGSMIFLTQNRSVWVATIIGVVAWWVVPRIRSGASGGLGGAGRTVLIVSGATVTALIGSSVAVLGQSANSDNTFLWRVARWADSMSIPRSWAEWLVGSAFGPTPASMPTLFPTSAHSLYVNAVEMTGFIGLAATLWLLIAVGRAHLPPSIEPLGLIVCVTFLSYGVTYQLPPWAWMVAGILLTSTRTGLTSNEWRTSPAQTSLAKARDREDADGRFNTGPIP